MYERMFTWIVGRVNRSVENMGSGAQPNSPLHKRSGSNTTSSERQFIGILDIYGFENQTYNGFEQLFINYANEKLQKLFNTCIFNAEELEYKKEGINHVKPRDFPDNTPTLELIERRPMGLFHLMQEECLRGKVGKDSNLVRKFVREHGEKGSKPHASFASCGPVSLFRNTTEAQFVIRHYAGAVIYTCEHFLEKNKDTLHQHVHELVSGASCGMVARIFSLKDGARRGRGSSVELPPSHRQVKARTASRPASRRSTALQATVAIKFKAQLNLLIKTINQTEPRFVRCIKTNHELKPRLVDRIAVLEQLRYAGVIAALEMRRAGFPSRMLYNDFLLSIHVLLEPRVLKAVRANACKNAKEETRKILTSRAVRESISADEYAFGNTKIFLRADVRHTLDGIMATYTIKSVTAIQRFWRCAIARKRFLLIRIAAQVGQRIVRGHLARKKLIT